MSRERFRVLVLALASLAAIVGATFVLDWYVATLSGAPMPIGEVTIDLREVRACSPQGPCGVVSLSASGAGGVYPKAATIAFWGGLLFAALLALQTATRVVSGNLNPSLSRAAQGVGALVLVAAVVAGYLAGIDLGSASVQGLGLTVARGWGPIAMIAGVVLGELALLAAAREDHDEPATVVVPQAYVPLAERQRGATRPPPLAAAPPVAERAKPVTMPPPPALQGKIAFAALAGEVTRAGIDARREDGALVLALWRDVVGIVARRLPPGHGGAPFVDIVSTAGATLRILPWTKLTGDPVPGDSDDARVRGLVKLLAQRCPDARLDGATQAYMASAEPAPQLPDEATLAAHDARLA